MFEDLKGEWHIVFLLLGLYILQGIPLGLSSTISILLQQQHVSYSDQAIFVICSQPYAMKMLWAPIVDALYSPKIGRRKSWIVPLQLLIGTMFIVLAKPVEDTIYSDNPNIIFLTVSFTLFYFLAATQDIAVDAWALTLLSKKNKSWQSTTNVIGQTLGMHLANSIFLALNDPHFLSSWKTSLTPLVTLREFALFWGVVYIAFTLIVYFFVHEDGHNSCRKRKESDASESPLIEKSENEMDEASKPLLSKKSKEDSQSQSDSDSTNSTVPEMSISFVYKLYYKILKNPNFISLALILLTNRIGVFPSEVASNLKLIDKGMKRVSLTSLKMFYSPFEMVLTFFISRAFTKIHPLKMMYGCYLWRITMAFLLGCFIHFLPEAESEMMASYYYPIAYLLIVVSSMSIACMNVSALAYYAQVSDPRFGGTYMSLFTTIGNFGHQVYQPLFLRLIDTTTSSLCLKNNDVLFEQCHDREHYMLCAAQQGQCHITRDGFYYLTWPSFIYGLIWAFVMKSQFVSLMSADASKWRLV